MAARKKKTTSASKRGHYIDNQKFFEAMSVYRERALREKAKGLRRPKIPDYIGTCFIKIAENLSQRPNFVNYTYRDQMISDGIENCVRYLDNFDPAKSRNPFAYFTQIVYYAFLRRIEEEKKQRYIKYKNAEVTGLTERIYAYQTEWDSSIRQEKNTLLGYQNIIEFIDDYEQKRKAKKLKRSKRAAATNIERFCETPEKSST